MTPVTLVSVLCPSSTSKERTRILLSSPFMGRCRAEPDGGAGLNFISRIFGSLPELVESLAERHDRIHVRLGVDPEIDEERPLRALRGVERRPDVLELLDPPRRQPVRLAQLHKVRPVRQSDLGPPTP